jgi:hypothetical protein
MGLRVKFACPLRGTFLELIWEEITLLPRSRWFTQQYTLNILVRLRSSVFRGYCENLWHNTKSCSIKNVIINKFITWILHNNPLIFLEIHKLTFWKKISCNFHLQFDRSFCNIPPIFFKRTGSNLYSEQHSISKIPSSFHFCNQSLLQDC